MATDASISHALALRGRLIKQARLRNEWYDDLEAPETFLAELRNQAVRPDIFSFIQRPPDVIPRFNYRMEMDHVAAIPITSYDEWWNKQVIKKVRKNVRRSEKYGVVVKTIPFDDDLVRGIQEIYGEVPLRSGRPFKHYGDDFETCKRKHETFSDRSTFIGAYYKSKLIGFIKIVFAGTTGRTMQNISMDQYRDLSPANAMLAHAVKECETRGISYLVYGKLEYGNKGNTGLEEFKKSNGFQRLEFPRYFVPITTVGQLAINTGLHREISDYVPRPIIQLARDVRTAFYQWRYPQKTRPQTELGPSDRPTASREAAQQE